MYGLHVLYGIPTKHDIPDPRSHVKSNSCPGLITLDKRSRFSINGQVLRVGRGVFLHQRSAWSTSHGQNTVRHVADWNLQKCAIIPHTCATQCLGTANLPEPEEGNAKDFVAGPVGFNCLDPSLGEFAVALAAPFMVYYIMDIDFLSLILPNFLAWTCENTFMISHIYTRTISYNKLLNGCVFMWFYVYFMVWRNKLNKSYAFMKVSWQRHGRHGHSFPSEFFQDHLDQRWSKPCKILRLQTETDWDPLTIWILRRWWRCVCVQCVQWKAWVSSAQNQPVLKQWHQPGRAGCVRSSEIRGMDLLSVDLVQTLANHDQLNCSHYNSHYKHRLIHISTC